MEEQNGAKEEKKSFNPLLDEVKAEREKLEKARDEARAQADRLEALRADQLLSGTAGGHVEAQPVKPETAKEYANRVMGNKLPAQKDDRK